VGTKNNPGEFDCFSYAEADEPMFTLLARDPTADCFVDAWVAIRCGDVDGAKRLMDEAAKELAKAGKPVKERTDRKMVEAHQCARAMRTWLQSRLIEKIEARLTSGGVPDLPPAHEVEAK
jgi:hypothetical protein